MLPFKSKRLAISALLSKSGFHLPIIEIFDGDENHIWTQDIF